MARRAALSATSFGVTNSPPVAPAWRTFLAHSLARTLACLSLCCWLHKVSPWPHAHRQAPPWLHACSGTKWNSCTSSSHFLTHIAYLLLTPMLLQPYSECGRRGTESRGWLGAERSSGASTASRYCGAAPCPRHGTHFHLQRGAILMHRPLGKMVTDVALTFEPDFGLH